MLSRYHISRNGSLVKPYFNRVTQSTSFIVYDGWITWGVFEDYVNEYRRELQSGEGLTDTDKIFFESHIEFKALNND